MTFNILIIEDEIKAAAELKQMVEMIQPDAKVLATVHSVKESVRWLNQNNLPHLIIADVQLGDGLSFEIFNLTKIQVPIIFCTGYDQYALKAFETNSIDYLLKPIDLDKLKNSLKKFWNLKESFSGVSLDYQLRINNMLDQLPDKNYKNTILAYSRDQIIPVSTEEVHAITTENSIIYLNTANQKHRISGTLNALAEDLNPTDFFRINRQSIISRKAVGSIRHVEARKLQIISSSPKPKAFLVSKDKATRFLKWLRL